MNEPITAGSDVAVGVRGLPKGEVTEETSLVCARETARTPELRSSVGVRGLSGDGLPSKDNRPLASFIKSRNSRQSQKTRWSSDIDEESSKRGKSASS